MLTFHLENELPLYMTVIKKKIKDIRMDKKRVVITGMGLVSCFGSDPKEFYKKLLAGESGIDFVNDLEIDELPTKFAARVKDFNAEEIVGRKDARRMDPVIPFAMSASRDAMKSANFDLEALDKTRAGVIIGTGVGGVKFLFENAKTLLTKGANKVSPFFIPYIITNMSSAKVAMDFGFKGPNYSITTACATSNHCIISAAQHIQAGHADVMLAGGVEATMNELCFAGFCSIKAMTRSSGDPKKASKPWDKKRDGFVMGEGAGVFVLESLDHALARGANILGEYKGGFVTCDAHHMTEPTPDGSDVARCMEGALKDAGLKSEQIDYINAHATSTPVGDLCEIRAIKKVFPKTLDRLKINGTKSMIGHALGGAGGLEMVAVLKAIEKNELHPTINITDLEEEIEGIDVVAGKSKKHDVKHALSNSFGFGGHNAVIAVSKYENRE